MKAAKFDDFHERTRYKLVQRACILLSVILVLITLQNLTNEHYSYFPNLIGSFIGISCLIVLHYTKSYRQVAMFLSIAGFFLITGTFFFLSNTLHYTTPLYMFMNILFTFFTLRHIWGFALLFAHFSMMVVYFYSRFIDNIAHLPAYTSQDLLTFSTEYLICGAGIGYLIYLFIKTSNYAEKELRIKNERLNNHYDVIYKQNKQKETMLKEIHHRVKNNLQIIVSLLRLQANSKENTGELKEFNDAINRINAMSLIHEKLYQSDMLTDFDLHKYLSSLAENIVDGFGSQDIDVKIEVNTSNLSSKTIVPLALLFNELLTNSIKHAFSGTNKAKIIVNVNDAKDNEFTVHYEDNGTWKSSDTESFGLSLIETMAEQLEGTYSLKKKEIGTVYFFELNNLI